MIKDVASIAFEYIEVAPYLPVYFSP